MTRDLHEQARQWIALGGIEGLSEEQQSSLHRHLEECDSCRTYAETADQLIRSIRSVPLAPAPGLVHTTQKRVRERARQLREERERLRLVGVSCFLVGLSTAITTPLLWRAFEWIGGRTAVATPLWEAAFALFAILPALVTSFLLLGRGVYVSGDRR
jgi:anti-sigma factor RsiW